MLASFNIFVLQPIKSVKIETWFQLVADRERWIQTRFGLRALLEVAVSLNIYSPPFRECLVFPPTGGAPKSGPCYGCGLLRVVL